MEFSTCNNSWANCCSSCHWEHTVIAKPAEQSSIIAYEIIKLFFKAGLPTTSLQLLLGDGEYIGAKILNDQRIKGVIFTGSCETAKKIQQNLSKKEGEIVPLLRCYLIFSK